jgi:DNA-binding Lrp family transcriptional regulator
MWSMSKNSREQLDEDEQKILSELVKNSKENIETIAKHCGLSKQKAWRLIKQLEIKDYIWGYTAVIDARRQGLQKFILLMKRSMKTINDKTADHIAAHGLITESTKFGVTVESAYFVLGEYDWEVIFTAPDLNQAKMFCDAINRDYPGLISHMHLMPVLVTKRSHNIPNPDKTILRKLL